MRGPRRRQGAAGGGQVVAFCNGIQTCLRLECQLHGLGDVVAAQPLTAALGLHLRSCSGCSKVEADHAECCENGWALAGGRGRTLADAGGEGCSRPQYSRGYYCGDAPHCE